MLNLVIALSIGLALAVWTPGGAARAQPSENRTVNTGRIAVLGDSLAVSPSRTAGFPSVLHERIVEKRLPWTIVNHGIPGDTTAGGLRRLDGILRERPHILILALGANDGLRGTPTSAVSENLSALITRAQRAGVRVLLCGMETPPLRGWAYTLAFHNIFPALARTHNVPLVPFLLVGVALDPEMNMEDMIHPNAAGARRIAGTIWPFLEPMLQVVPVASTGVE